MFQNGVKAIEEVLEVATYCPKHSFVFFKAEAKELLSEMLPQLTERYSCEGEMQNTICLLRIDTNDQRHAIKRSAGWRLGSLFRYYFSTQKSSLS